VRKMLVIVVAGFFLWVGGPAALRLLALPMAEPEGAALARDGSERLEPAGRFIVCSGRVEATQGEIDVTAQITGNLAAVNVTEGDRVRKGDVLAEVEGLREAAEAVSARASVALARSRLAQVQAGSGKEEQEQAQHEVDAVEAELVAETSSLNRARRAGADSVSAEELEHRQQHVRQLQSQRAGLQKRYEALRRGALPQEIEVARSEVALAEARLARAELENAYRVIRAPRDAIVVQVYRHAGDSVTTLQISPVVRLVDPSALLVRLEVDEANVQRMQTGLEANFTIQGGPSGAGQLVVKTIVPAFGPKRLFNPDTSVRVDTRTLSVLCEPRGLRVPLYPGQRVTARFTLPGRPALYADAQLN
jgi:HlyD family secretion protein